MINVHMTHHGGTTFCGAIGMNGRQGRNYTPYVILKSYPLLSLVSRWMMRPTSKRSLSPMYTSAVSWRHCLFFFSFFSFLKYTQFICMYGGSWSCVAGTVTGVAVAVQSNRRVRPLTSTVCPYGFVGIRESINETTLEEYDHKLGFSICHECGHYAGSDFTLNGRGW